MVHRILLITLVACLVLSGARADEVPAKPTSIFEAPRQAALVQQVQGILAGLLKAQRYKEAEALLRQAITKQPAEPTHLYNLACVLALQMEPDQALEQLELAAAKGFADVGGLEADADLASLRETERYKKVVETLKEKAKTPVPPRTVAPRKIVDEAAVVDDANTIWDARQGLFRPQFEFGDNPRAMAEAVVGHGTAGELVRGWQKEGTAAGLWGILYDNQDRQHSPLPRTDFPQLTPTA